jgi:hypothetical protein
MADKQEHLAPSKPIAPQPARRGALYLFCVLVAAVFVVVVAMGREKAGKFKATAVLLGTSKVSEQAPSLESVQQKFVNSALIREALDEVFTSVSADATPPASADVRQSLGVGQNPDTTSQRTTISVTYSGSSADRAQEIVNKICDVFVRHENAGSVVEQPAEQNEMRRHEAVPADAAQQQAEQNLLDAQARLEAFDQEYASALAAPQRELGLPAKDETSPVVEQPKPQPKVDSELQPQRSSKAEPTEAEQKITQLESEITSRNQQLNALLGTMTREHPLVKTILGEISGFESQISALRAKAKTNTKPGVPAENAPIAPSSGQAQLALEPDHPERITAPKSDVAPLSTEPMLSSQERKQLLAVRAELEQHVRDAEQELQLAKGVERQQWEQQFATDPVPSWDVEHATTAQRVYTPTKPSLLVFALVLGLVAGGGLLIAGTGPATINTPAAAQSAVSVPVIGNVPEPLGRSLDQPKRPIAMRILVLCAETTLFVFLAAMIVAALSDKQFASQLRADPLAALADGVRHVLDFVRR